MEEWYQESGEGWETEVTTGTPAAVSHLNARQATSPTFPAESIPATARNQAPSASAVRDS